MSMHSMGGYLLLGRQGSLRDGGGEQRLRLARLSLGLRHLRRVLLQRLRRRGLLDDRGRLLLLGLGSRRWDLLGRGRSGLLLAAEVLEIVDEDLQQRIGL